MDRPCTDKYGYTATGLYLRCAAAACAVKGGGPVRCDELGAAVWPPPPPPPQPQNSPLTTKLSNTLNFTV
jgi:hypothetical protein